MCDSDSHKLSFPQKEGKLSEFRESVKSKKREFCCLSWWLYEIILALTQEVAGSNNFYTFLYLFWPLILF